VNSRKHLSKNKLQIEKFINIYIYRENTLLIFLENLIFKFLFLYRRKTQDLIQINFITISLTPHFIILSISNCRTIKYSLSFADHLSTVDFYYLVQCFPK